MAQQKPAPGTGGEHYIPYSERTGEESIVYFTRDLSPDGLERIFDRIGGNLHTAEINICRSAPKEIPGKVKIYYSDPYGKEIMVEEFAQDTAAGDTAIFLAYALVPLGLYFLLRYLLF